MTHSAMTDVPALPLTAPNPSPFRAWFGCAAGCPGENPLNKILYYCPTCGGLLDVQHDINALKTRTPQEWRHLFDERYRRTLYPYGSGGVGQERNGVSGD